MSLPADALEVGRIHGAWGVSGGFKVESYSAEARALQSAEVWHLLTDGSRKPVDASPVPETLKIKRMWWQGRFWVASAEGIEDRDLAQSLQGVTICLSRGDFPDPGPYRYYWADLIGLQVLNRQGELLGRVDHLIEAGSQSVLVLKNSDLPGGELLIPFVPAYVDDVDLEAQRITVDWQTGY